MKISITEPARLSEVLDLIHDCWFDVQEIKFERGTAELVIPFKYPLGKQAHTTSGIWPFNKRQVFARAYLGIQQVEDYQLNDTSGVGIHDFNTLEYNETIRRLRITTGVPMDFEVKVKSFEVTVRITDDIVGVSDSAQTAD